jgi:hypothetical protein
MSMSPGETSSLRMFSIEAVRRTSRVEENTDLPAVLGDRHQHGEPMLGAQGVIGIAPDNELCGRSR